MLLVALAIIHMKSFLLGCSATDKAQGGNSGWERTGEKDFYLLILGMNLRLKGRDSQDFTCIKTHPTAQGQKVHSQAFKGRTGHRVKSCILSKCIDQQVTCSVSASAVKMALQCRTHDPVRESSLWTGTPGFLMTHVVSWIARSLRPTFHILLRNPFAGSLSLAVAHDPSCA